MASRAHQETRTDGGPSTIVVRDGLCARETRLELARDRRHGVRVSSLEGMVARLAGGFLEAIGRDPLQDAVRVALTKPLGELDEIKALPGMTRAAVATLEKLWSAQLDLKASTASGERIAALLLLEEAVLDALPAHSLRPADLVARARERLAFAPAVLGEIEVRGFTEMAPCWRPLLAELAETLPIRWIAGPREVPAWLEALPVDIVRSVAERPDLQAVTCANSRAEVVEALRWARRLLAEGEARPEEIAIAAATPGEFDDHLLAAARESGLEIHFAHGIRAATTRDGQTAAAVAEVLLRGLSRARAERLFRLLPDHYKPLEDLPSNWARVLPKAAPLQRLNLWKRFFAGLSPGDWPGGRDRSAELLTVLELLDRGPTAAEDAGETLLSGVALSLWRKALKEGPAGALDVTLEDLRLRDGLEPATSIAWMPAGTLAACPRPWVRLLGLTARGWPRGLSEDRLLPHHVVPLEKLDPLPIAEADRRDFRTILATTARSVTLSRSRRDANGRQLGRSPLFAAEGLARLEEVDLRAGRVPEHAMSEADRLLARTTEFAKSDVAIGARACWSNWHKPELTAHDGLVRSDHPAIQRLLQRVQSATSLSLLLRDPLGYLWRYGLGWTAPEPEAEPLALDPRAFGQLLHEVLDGAVRRLEAAGGFAAASGDRLAEAVEEAAREIGAAWEESFPVPPGILWQATLKVARKTAVDALVYELEPLQGQSSWTELTFGQEAVAAGSHVTEPPWQSSQTVLTPRSEFRIAGKIDRLDLSGDGLQARVLDYKGGKIPRDEPTLSGGAELQRCLYAFAVKALLGAQVAVEVGLLYPRDGGQLFWLAQPDDVLRRLDEALVLAQENLRAGRALPGVAAEDRYNDLAFALPGNAKLSYCEVKLPLARGVLGAAADIWSAA